MIFVDSNVILDVMTKDPIWYDWSSETLKKYSEQHRLYINAIIYAEVSINFSKIEDLNEILSPEYFEYLPISVEVAFLAGKIFVQYRRNSGNKQSPLPDFFVGAHAALLGSSLITRYSKRYRTYFPQVKLIHPELDKGT